MPKGFFCFVLFFFKDQMLLVFTSAAFDITNENKGSVVSAFLK